MCCMKGVLLMLVCGLCLTGLSESKKYYVFKSIKVNWHAAFLDCLSRNLQLATVNSNAEQQDLDAAVNAADNSGEWFYISGTDQAEEGNFVWMSTGKAVTYSRFFSGEPNNYKRREHCLIVVNENGAALWNDSWCLHKLFYICEDKPEINCNAALATCKAG